MIGKFETKPTHRATAVAMVVAGSAFLGIGASSSQAATITSAGSTGVFDEGTNATNQLEIEYPASTLAAFKSTVAAAYANNLGGVIDWETGVAATTSATTSPNNTLTSVDVVYGVAATNTLTVTLTIPWTCIPTV